MTSQTLPGPDVRILDARQLRGPDSLADILAFLCAVHRPRSTARNPSQAGPSDSPTSTA